MWKLFTPTPRCASGATVQHNGPTVRYFLPARGLFNTHSINSEHFESHHVFLYGTD